jgi:subtilisin family serine protease
VKNSKSTSLKSNELLKRQRRRKRNRAMQMESLERREMLAADFAVSFDAPAVENELVIQYVPGTSPARAALEAATRGWEVVSYFENLDSAHVRYVGTPGAGGGNDPAGNDPAGNGLGNAVQITGDLLSDWESSDQVLLAEPNYIQQPSAITPDDTLVGQQWGLRNIGQNNPQGPGVPGADIKAFEAWEISVGSPDVVIAIIDTGFGGPPNDDDYTPNAWVNTGEIPNNLIDDDNNGKVDDINGWNFAANIADFSDQDGHGTHVAGTASAAGNNGLLTTGVSWNTKLMILKAGDPSFAVASLLGAYDYMIEQKNRGVNLVASNNSYGGDVPSGIIEAGVNATTAAGILFVAASGNDGRDVDAVPAYPAGYVDPGIISVGASDPSDQLAVFSNNGQVSVDIHAPGVDILSLQPGNLSGFLDGTSMASPHVTGAIAVLASVHPGATAAELKQYLLAGSDREPAYAGQSVSGGRLNLLGAIEAIPKGFVRGVVFDDANNNGQQDAGELGVGGVKVILDINRDGVESPIGEFSDFSAADGSYQLPNYFASPNFQLIIENPPSPFVPPAPIIVVGPGRGIDLIGNIPLPRERPSFIGGVVYDDDDQNGQKDSTEPGIGGVYVFLDLNNNDRLEIGEPVTTSAAETGLYNFSTGFGLSARDYTVRPVMPAGWSLSSPTSLEHMFTVGNSANAITDMNFGFFGGNLLDFADLGSDTTLASDGPRHGVLAGFHLGAGVGGEIDAVTNDTFDDGVSITSTVFAGGTVTADVVVSLGGFRPGYLQAWVDSDNSGTYTASEQVISNLRLLEGTSQVSFALPSDSVSGQIAARFRYGWEFGMGATGAAMAGEVEDYLLNVAGDNPLAFADAFTVDENSTNTNLDVLANDLASSAGGIFVASLGTGSTSGTVTIASGGQSVVYTPQPSFSGIDSFTYVLEDSAGTQSSATVTVSVTPTFGNPVAINDQAVVAANSVINQINVLANDLPGQQGPLRITNVIAGANGTVAVETSGTTDPTDDVVTYTPNQNFDGFDQFSYVVTDGVGVTSTAVVTVFVGNSTVDDTTRYSVEFTQLDGATPLTNNEVALGAEFLANFFVEDIRLVDGSLPESDKGIFAAYLDVLYPAGAVSLTTGLLFNGDFQSLPEGSTFTPGLIDEAGAFQDVTASPPGAGKQLVFRARFRANALGVVTIVPNIADQVLDPGPPSVSGDHDTLFWSPVGPALPDQISFLTNSITVIANGQPVQNVNSPTDVNNDGRVNPLDVLLVAQAINAAQGVASGESQALFVPSAAGVYADVDGSGRVNMRDLLAVVSDYYERSQAGESAASDILSVQPASGEAIDFSNLSTVASSVSNTPAQEQVSNGESLAELPVLGHDADEDVALNDYLGESDTVDEEDDFFADILGALTE